MLTCKNESMNYVTVSARFLFFNGKESYTIEYCYGLSKWFVFKETEATGAVYQKEDKKVKLKDVNCWSAEEILKEYIDSINQNSNPHE